MAETRLEKRVFLFQKMKSFSFFIILWAFWIDLVHGIDPIVSASFKLHRPNQTSTAIPRGGSIQHTHPAISCTAQQAQALVHRFHTEHRDYSACPREDWLVLMARADQRNKVLVNIGVNKGYNFAVWLNLFSSWNRITPAVWASNLCHKKQAVRTCCGICDDCKVVFNNVSTRIPAHPPHITMIGVDLNNNNLLAIERVLEGIHQDYDTHSVSIFTVHAAISDLDGSIPLVSNCLPGEESCNFKDALSTTERIAAWTPDKLVKNFVSDHATYFRRYHTSQSSHHWAYHPTVDILMIDVEGYDPLALKGAHGLLSGNDVRCVIFEYHKIGPWQTHKLENIINTLDRYGYDCYFQGQGRLWQITNCWDAGYEFRDWSNVMCVLRKDIWHHVLQSIVVKV